jgi:hypothetical protein
VQRRPTLACLQLRCSVAQQSSGKTWLREPGAHLAEKNSSPSASSSGVKPSSEAGNKMTRRRKVLTGVPGTRRPLQYSSNISCRPTSSRKGGAPSCLSCKPPPRCRTKIGQNNPQAGPHLHVVVIPDTNEAVWVQFLARQDVFHINGSIQLLAQPEDQFGVRTASGDIDGIGFASLVAPFAIESLHSNRGR